MSYASSGRLENRSGLLGSSVMFVRTKRRAWRACGESIKGEENQRKAALFCRENSCALFSSCPCTCERSCDQLADRQCKLTGDFLTISTESMQKCSKSSPKQVTKTDVAPFAAGAGTTSQVLIPFLFQSLFPADTGKLDHASYRAKSNNSNLQQPNRGGQRKTDEQISQVNTTEMELLLQVSRKDNPEHDTPQSTSISEGQP
jgi:hypothetical protein